MRNESTLRVTLLIQSYGWHHCGRTSYWDCGTWLLVQTIASPTCGPGIINERLIRTFFCRISNDCLKKYVNMHPCFGSLCW